MKQQTHLENYNSLKLFLLIWKWKYPLLIICVTAVVLSTVFSAPFFIRPKFKSTAIIYAPRTNSLAKILTNPDNPNERLDIKAYAERDETEHAMQILNTTTILDLLISKFNLYEHYNIDPNGKYKNFYTYGILRENIKIKRTEYGAIAVTVYDWDPQLASDMANQIVYDLDSVKNAIEKERVTAAYHILQKQLESVNKELTAVDDSLSILLKHGVFDFDQQTNRLIQQYAIATAQGNTTAVQRIEKAMENLAQWGPKVAALRELKYNFAVYHAAVMSKMLDAKVDMEAQMPVKFVIEKAFPSERKAFPKRSIIVAATTASTFVLAILFLLIMENLHIALPFLNKKKSEKSEA